MCSKYTDNNVSLLRANSASTAFASGDVNEHNALSYSNLFFPFILDNGGNTRIVSLTIDIFNQDTLVEETKDLPNKDWVAEERLRDDLISSKSIWGFREAFHASKKSRSLSNAFCFDRQKLTFYIAPQGQSAGYIDNRWVYCRTSLTLTIKDVINNNPTVTYTFDDFEADAEDSSRFFEWTVPDKYQQAFDDYGFFGLHVVSLDIEHTYYEDAELTKPLAGNYPSSNQALLQLLTYSGAKEIIEVDGESVNILKSTPSYDDTLKEIFEKTVFDDLESLNLNELTDDQKRAIIADQIAALFISQHPVVTGDYYPSSILGWGVEEAVLPRKVISKAVTYSKRYPDLIPLVKDRLFGMVGAFKAFNYTFDIERIISDYTQSSQVVRDPVRVISVDSEGVLATDAGVDGIIFDPYAVDVANAEFMNVVPESVPVDLPLFHGLVDAENILISNPDGEELEPLERNVKVSFDVTYGEDDIDEIRYVLFTLDGLNYEEYIDVDGTTRSHTFILDPDRAVVLSPALNGDVASARIDIKDTEGGVSSFYGSQFIEGDYKSPSLYNLKIYQRNDGSRIVDVMYDYLGLGEINNSYVYAQFSIDNGVTWSTVGTASLKGDFGNNVMPGRRVVSWQPEEEDAIYNYRGIILCRLTLYDVDSFRNVGEPVTGVLVWDVNDPEVAVRRLSFEEEYHMIESSSSSGSSSSSSSSLSSSSYSSSSSSSSSMSSSSSSSSQSFSSSSSSSSNSSSSSEQYSSSSSSSFSSSSSSSSSSNSSSSQSSSSSSSSSTSSESIGNTSSSSSSTSSESIGNTSSSSSSADVLVTTGSIAPDATGTYNRNGTYDEHWVYERTDGSYWIWHIPGGWALSTAVGDLSTFWASTSLEGIYTPFLGAVGNATVARG